MELRSVEELMELLNARRGARDIPECTGDPVDPHEHALRTAALLRRSRPADTALQIAGLVHDVGRLLRPGHGPARPGHGADALRPLLGERVSRLVRLNVSAARYLALVSPDRGPSPRGALALVRQGGPMTPAEAAGFEQDPLAEDAVTLRQADAAGRVAGFDAGVPEDWRTVLELVAARRAPLPVPDAVRHHHLPGA